MNQGGPLTVLDLTDRDGKQFAKVVMTGKEMIVDDYGLPVSGPGYVEGVGRELYYVPFKGQKGLFGLKIKRVEWDGSGKPVAAKGARVLQTEKGDIAVVAGDSPKVADGTIYLKLEGHGEKEYGFKTHFHRGESVDPEDFD